MRNVECPHCHSYVPHGAKVCRGCQAGMEYGTPPVVLLFVVLVAGFAAWYVGAATHAVLGWIVFVALLASGVYGSTRVFRDRINFKRLYRTA
jgi:hypothetical protein